MQMTAGGIIKFLRRAISVTGSNMIGKRVLKILGTENEGSPFKVRVSKRNKSVSLTRRDGVKCRFWVVKGAGLVKLFLKWGEIVDLHEFHEIEHF